MPKPKVDANARRRVLLAQEQAPAVEGDLSAHWFEVARCGDYYDWRYGNFTVTAELLAALKSNFDSNVLGVKVALDCNHQPEAGAKAWIAQLDVRGGSLFARFDDWTPEGEKAVRDGEFRYFSIDFEPLELPADDGVKVIPNVLKGIALTNRPVLKGMEGTFAEKDNDIKNPAPDAGTNRTNMKNIVKKFSDALLASEKVSAADVERLAMMLAELPEGDRAELKEASDKVAAKAAETAKMELADKAKASDVGKQLADAATRLAAVEGVNATLLAEKAERETKEVIDSMMLSETNRKGFPAGKRAEVEAMVKDVGVENARKFAAKLAEAVDMTGKTEEIGTGAAGGGSAASDAEAKELAEKRSKDTGKPMHVCLADVYAEREAAAAK